MPISADRLLDTSVAVALVLPNHEAHDAVIARTRGLTLGLGGHAAIETFSVLTRLPGPQRLTASDAWRIIREDFPGTVTLSTPALEVAAEFARSGVVGGAVYDGLVGLSAREAGMTLLTRDQRAAVTYARLGVTIEVV